MMPLRQETNAGKADMHILHSLPAALIRRGNIDPVHKIMQHSGRQFLQVGIFLRPEDETAQCCRLLPPAGQSPVPKSCIFSVSSVCSFFIVGGQLFKSAIIDFAGDIVLIEPFEQTVKLFHPALCLRELSALCGEFFLEVLLAPLHPTYPGTYPRNRRSTKAGFAEISARPFPEQTARMKCVPHTSFPFLREVEHTK